MTSPSPRLWAIGDIHGCLGPLQQLVSHATFTPTDTLVILGDTVNRGPNSKGVIDYLIGIQKQLRVVLVLGNHEEEMLAARHSRQAEDRWLEMGGTATLASYGPECNLDDIPKAHWDFLESFVPFWETEDYIFTHANYDGSRPMDQQLPTTLRWLSIHDSLPHPHCSGKTVVLGHSANLSGHVIDYGFFRCIDTGCGLGGCLTLMDVCSKEIWQAPQ